MSRETKVLIGAAVAAVAMFVFALGRLSGEAAKVSRPKEDCDARKEFTQGVRFGMCLRPLHGTTNGIWLSAPGWEAIWNYHRQHPEFRPDPATFATDGKWREETFEREK